MTSAAISQKNVESYTLFIQRLSVHFCRKQIMAIINMKKKYHPAIFTQNQKDI